MLLVSVLPSRYYCCFSAIISIHLNHILVLMAVRVRTRSTTGGWEK